MLTYWNFRNLLQGWNLAHFLAERGGFEPPIELLTL